jgi:hypothetical protein
MSYPLYAFGIARQNQLLQINNMRHSMRNKKKVPFLNVSEIKIFIGELLIKAGKRLSSNSRPHELHNGSVSF